MFTIENEELKVAISSRGAELQSIFNKQTRLEYLWNGDPAFWSKRSPILFPVVGALKEDTYYYANKHYKLSRHGFARDREFETWQQQDNAITFLLKSDEATLQNFPFEFELKVSYSLQQNSLRVAYNVKNISASDMYFSVGGHPAFKVPLVPGTAYDDYYLEFNEDEQNHDGPSQRKD